MITMIFICSMDVLQGLLFILFNFVVGGFGSYEQTFSGLEKFSFSNTIERSGRGRRLLICRRLITIWTYLLLNRLFK